MTDTWRKKTYYRPRILIQTQACLDSDIPGGIVCLSGGAINMLRALLEYAERRSTFVTEYEASYYLSPTEAEWEDLQHLVAETQENLMACTDIETLLADLLDCCRNGQAAMWPDGGIHTGQRDYDDYVSTVEYLSGSPPTGFADWDTWLDYKCKAAQKIVDEVYELGNKLEVWYSAGASITFAVFQSFLLATSVAPPVALVLAILSILAVAGTAAAMIAFQNWVSTNKRELVCIIHDAATTTEAKAEIDAYILAEWDIEIAAQFGQHFFSNDVLSKAYDGGLDVSEYSADYCLACVPMEGLSHAWAFPSDTDWTCHGPNCYYDAQGNLYIGESSYALSPIIEAPAGDYDIDLYMTGCDSGSGAKVDAVIQGSNNLVDWYDTGLTWSPNFPACPTIGAWGPTWDAANWTYAYARYKVAGRAASAAEFHTFEGEWVGV